MSIGKSEHAWLTEKLDAALAKVAELENEATDSMAAFVLVRDENARLKAAGKGLCSNCGFPCSVVDRNEELEAEVERWKDECKVQQQNDALGQTQLRELREALQKLVMKWMDYAVLDTGGVPDCAADVEALLAKVAPCE